MTNSLCIYRNAYVGESGLPAEVPRNFKCLATNAIHTTVSRSSIPVHIFRFSEKICLVSMYLVNHNVRE